MITDEFERIFGKGIDAYNLKKRTKLVYYSLIFGSPRNLEVCSFLVLINLFHRWTELQAMFQFVF